MSVQQFPFCCANLEPVQELTKGVYRHSGMLPAGIHSNNNRELLYCWIPAESRSAGPPERQRREFSGKPLAKMRMADERRLRAGAREENDARVPCRRGLEGRRSLQHHHDRKRFSQYQSICLHMPRIILTSRARSPIRPKKRRTLIIQ